MEKNCSMTRYTFSINNLLGRFLTNTKINDLSLWFLQFTHPVICILCKKIYLFHISKTTKVLPEKKKLLQTLKQSIDFYVLIPLFVKQSNWFL